MIGEMWRLAEAGEAPSADGVDRVVSAQAVRLGREGVLQAKAQLSDRVLGAGPLQPLIDQPEVTDVLVNGTNGVWVDRGEGLVAVPGLLHEPAEVRRLAVRLAGLAGRRLDDASPYVDGLLPGGVRLHAILPPLVDGAAHICLRVPRRCAPTLTELLTWQAAPLEWLPVFERLVASRASFVITGGAGTGKTTLLAALLGLVDPQQRVVIVEDVRELAVDHPHVVRLAARPANVEERGAIDLTAVVRQSLRMRPDRLVVGEVRGAEVRELLAALNTGHDGGCGTVHANGTHDVVARFEALGALAGLSPAATRAQLGSAVQVVIHLRRSGSLRRISTIAMLTTDRRSGLIDVVPALEHRPDGSDGPARTELGPGWLALAHRIGLDHRARHMFRGVNAPVAMASPPAMPSPPAVCPPAGLSTPAGMGFVEATGSVQPLDSMDEAAS